MVTLPEGMGTPMKLNRIVLYGMILVLFFEAYAFSVTVFGARIRMVQALNCIAVFVVLAGFFCKRWPLQKTRFNLFLLGYLSVNALAILKSKDPQRSVKITVLLFSLILLFYVFAYLLLKREVFTRSFRLLLWVGIIEMFYGLYQVAAGMINLILKVNLPIGTSGLAQAGYIGAPWGRPYGTFVEADWFGAVCLFYALLFLVLTFSQAPRRRFYRVGLVLSLAALFLGFVRGAWAGFLFGLTLFLVLRKRIRGLRFKPVMIIKPAAILLLAVIILLIISPQIRHIFQKRFLPVSGEERLYTFEIRWIAIKESFHSFLKSPLLGHGPGSVGRTMAFNPSLLTTLVEDTGLIGLILFVLFLFFFFQRSAREIPHLDEQDQPVSFGIFIALAGLLASYLITCGMWMPFTWVFIAFADASLRSTGRSQFQN